MKIVHLRPASNDFKPNLWKHLCYLNNCLSTFFFAESSYKQNVSIVIITWFHARPIVPIGIDSQLLARKSSANHLALHVLRRTNKKVNLFLIDLHPSMHLVSKDLCKTRRMRSFVKFKIGSSDNTQITVIISTTICPNIVLRGNKMMIMHRHDRWQTMILERMQNGRRNLCVDIVNVTELRFLTINKQIHFSSSFERIQHATNGFQCPHSKQDLLRLHRT